MAFWWVSQNQTYKKEMEGGYLWAPKRGKSNRIPHHWKTLLSVQDGDIIFSSYKQKIVAVSTVLSKAYNFDNPFPKNEWEKNGNKIDLNYHVFDNPIDIKNISNDLFKILNVYHGPLNVNKHVNEGYLFEVSDEAGSKLLTLIESQNKIDIETEFVKDVEKSKNSETTRKAIVDSRIGHSGFKKDLISYWNGKCAVTGISLTDILIASHIKPWKVSNNKERLDEYNGLLLSPNYDKLFDSGYISFNDDGKIIISTVLNESDINELKISSNDSLLKNLEDKHKKYLEYHRNIILLPQ